MSHVRAQWELCTIILGGALLFFWWGEGLVRAQGDSVRPQPVPSAISPIEKTLGIRKTMIPEQSEFKTDPDYRKILRYDFLPYWLNREKKERVLHRGEAAPTVRNQDKAMVLAGKGFQIPDLQRFEPDPGVEINEYGHIDFDAPVPPLGERRDHLDRAFGGAVYKKDLIFHSHLSGFHNVEPRRIQEDVRPEKAKPLDPPPVRESRLLLRSSGKTRLTLAPGKKQWDLLHDDEYLTRLDYAHARRIRAIRERADSSPSNTPARSR